MNRRNLIRGALALLTCGTPAGLLAGPVAPASIPLESWVLRLMRDLRTGGPIAQATRAALADYAKQVEMTFRANLSGPVEDWTPDGEEP